MSVNVDPMARNNERDALDWGESLRVAVTVGGERYLLSDAIVFGAEKCHVTDYLWQDLFDFVA